MRWFRRRPKAKIEVIKREVCRLTVQEWRADPGWVGTGASVLSDPRLRQMLDVVGNSSPAFEVLPYGTAAQDRLVAQARAEGYTMALANLEALGVQQALRHPVEATFEEPQKMEVGL